MGVQGLDLFGGVGAVPAQPDAAGSGWRRPMATGKTTRAGERMRTLTTWSSVHACTLYSGVTLQ
eukprot:1824433-Rhodomonas_salina.1